MVKRKTVLAADIRVLLRLEDRDDLIKFCSAHETNCSEFLRECVQFAIGRPERRNLAAEDRHPLYELLSCLEEDVGELWSKLRALEGRP